MVPHESRDVFVALLHGRDYAGLCPTIATVAAVLIVCTVGTVLPMSATLASLRSAPILLPLVYCYYYAVYSHAVYRYAVYPRGTG